MNTAIGFGMDSTEQTEQIIKLRVQLARNKSKIIKYDELLAQLAHADLQMTKITENFAHNETLLYDIASQLKIDTFPCKTWSKDGQKQRDGSGFIKQIIIKYEQILKIGEKEQEIIRLISKKVDLILKQNSCTKDSLKQIEAIHASCSLATLQSQQQADQVHKLQTFLKQKERELTQTTKNMRLIEQKSRITQSKLQVSLNKNSQLQIELNEKNRQIERQMGQVVEGEMVATARQTILQKCRGLIANTQIGDQQYLSHYLRSNGLSLQVQRPYKNKYSMVFD